MKRALSVIATLLLVSSLSTPIATAKTTPRTSVAASDTPGAGLPPGWTHQHTMQYALPLLQGNNYHVGPSTRTYGGVGTITGWHHPFGQFQAWQADNTVTNIGSPVPGPDGAATGCSWYNPTCWSWFGSHPGCTAGIGDWFCGMLWDTGLAPTIAPFVEQAAHDCWTGALNIVVNTWLAGMIAQRYALSGLGTIVVGPKGWAALAIGGCIFGLVWFK